MGEEGSKHVFERVADVLARLGGDPRGARPRSGSGESGTHTVPVSGTEQDRTNGGEPGRAVTDGGANGAPPGDVPWADDDPIVFGEADDADPGAAILDAVTDPDGEATPPFGDADASAGTQPETGEEGTNAVTVDPDRLDELEARLDALEGDHVQLETRLADLARGVADLREELSGTGEEVRLLVAALGGIAIAREGDAGSPDGRTDLEAALDDVDPDDLEATLGTLSELGESETEPRAEDEAGPAVNDAGSHDDDGAPDSEPARADEEAFDDAALDDEAAFDDEAALDDEAAADEQATFDDEAPPEGIYRGAGELPSQSTADAPAVTDDRPPDGGPSTPTDGSVQQSTDGPARKLVDPRTDAVGARLRQFREGFLDDPTEDLPTGNAADEFRFEKVLLPTDGEEAPDLSNAELEKPYLEALPDGYAADAVILEWLDWLVSAADGEVAARAVVYYESIGWLTEEVRDDLLAYLEGLGENAQHRSGDGMEADDRVEPPAELDLQDHLRSLQYVTELASGEVEADGI